MCNKCIYPSPGPRICTRTVQYKSDVFRSDPSRTTQQRFNIRTDITESSAAYHECRSHLRPFQKHISSRPLELGPIEVEAKEIFCYNFIYVCCVLYRVYRDSETVKKRVTSRPLSQSRQRATELAVGSNVRAVTPQHANELTSAESDTGRPHPLG